MKPGVGRQGLGFTNSECAEPRGKADLGYPQSQGAQVYPVALCALCGGGLVGRSPTPGGYFLNRFSNAARASFGFKLAGVEVSFSRVTRIS